MGESCCTLRDGKDRGNQENINQSHQNTRDSNKKSKENPPLKTKPFQQLQKMRFQNLGNTCWMNSGLQCLLHTTPLVQYFLNDFNEINLNKVNKYGTGGVMTKQFVHIVQETSDNYQKTFSPIAFKQALIRFAPQFREGKQHDSQQFINFFLDALHEDLNKNTEKPYIEGIPSDGRSDEEVSQECWERYLKRNNSKIVEIMHGQFKSSLKCAKCNSEQITFDPFQLFCVEIPQNKKNQAENRLITLYDCLNFYQQEEKLDGQNKFQCKNCGKNEEGYKQLSLYKIPEIFIIYLKRFKQIDQTIQKNKINVDYPLMLDLTKLLPKNYQESTKYDLYAVNIHSGSVEGGHYYAYAKEGDKWYEFDDSYVSECSKVQSPNAYALFYRRRQKQ